MQSIFGQINYWAVVVSAIVYWLIGMVWFCAIVGKDWSNEIKKHGIKVHKPNTATMVSKSIWTFILNFIVAWAVGYVVYATGAATFAQGLKIGVILAIGIAVAVMLASYIWESRPAKLSFYDVFYPFLGIVVSAIILALWR